MKREAKKRNHESGMEVKAGNRSRGFGRKKRRGTGNEIRERIIGVGAAQKGGKKKKRAIKPRRRFREEKGKFDRQGANITQRIYHTPTKTPVKNDRQ